MAKNRSVWGGLRIVALALLPTVAAAQELPATLQLVGSVTPDGVSPASLRGASVLVIDKASGNQIAAGPILDERGTFFVDIFQNSTFNGRILRLQIIHAGRTYDLHDGSAVAELPFAGSFPFPTRVTKPVTVRLGPPPSAAPAPDADKNDVNRDGVFDERDIDRLRTALSEQSSDSRFDINADGVFNSLDVVESRRALLRVQSSAR